MAKVILQVDHPEYDDDLQYTGIHLDIKEVLDEPMVRLEKSDGTHTLHRYKLVSKIELE